MKPQGLVALLADVSRSGLYRLPEGDGEKLIAAAGELGYAIRIADLRGLRDKAGLLAGLARALAFPDWFGYNWDALDDCLADLSWLGDTGFLIVLEHGEDLRTGSREDFATALKIFEAAAGFWRSRDTAFWVLVDAPAGAAPDFPDFEA
ncbi:MAG: barstar family protein [Rhodocyclaceae bacterium]